MTIPRRATQWPLQPMPILAFSLMLGIGLAGCAQSGAVLAEQPDFQMATPAGIASVSIRQAPPDMTDAQFLELVKAGMTQAAPGSLVPGSVRPPYPTTRIVWHVDLTPPHGMARIAVNVFRGDVPYAYEQDAIANGEPANALTDTIRALSSRLLADIAAHLHSDTLPKEGR